MSPSEESPSASAAPPPDWRPAPTVAGWWIIKDDACPAMGTDESYSIEETVVVDRLLYGVTFGRPAELRLKVFSSRHWAGPYTSKALAEANRPPTPPDPVSVE